MNWLIRAATNKETADLAFSQYIHMVSFFCMFGDGELLQFMYGSMLFDAEQEEELLDQQKRGMTELDKRNALMEKQMKSSTGSLRFVLLS